MSKIKIELMTAAEMTPKRGEEEGDFLIRLQKAISEDISEEVWNKLSPEAQDWNNDAADAITDGKAIPGFPDAVKEEPKKEEAAPARRGRSAAKDEPKVEEFKLKTGALVQVETKRGKKAVGVVVEFDDEVIVINPKGEEGAKEDDEEFNRSNVTVTAAAAEKKSEDPKKAEPEAPVEPQVGDTVEVVTARDKVIVGNVIELSEETVVLKDATGEEHELGINRLKSFKVKVKNSGAAKKEEAPASGRRGRAASSEEKAEPAADKEKTKRVSNEGVSIGQRIKELICEDMKASVEDIAAQLKKEKLEFRDGTLKLVYADAHKLLTILKTKKMIK